MLNGKKAAALGNSKADFFAAEEICGNYVSKQMKKVWAVNLDLLKEFQQFCESQQLEYFMGFGTLLGAYRHGGFIPWDDDVDILMPRADFEKLKGLAHLFCEPYFLQTTETDPTFWHRGMIKLRNSNTTCIEKQHLRATFNQGIGLEILPLDYSADDPRERKKQESKISICQRLLWARLYKKDYHLEGVSGGIGLKSKLKWSIYCLVARFIDTKKLERWILNCCILYINSPTKNFSIYTSYGKKYILLPATAFSGNVKMKFENLLLPAPIGFWDCLQKQYGQNFLRYVSDDQREPHHPAFWNTEEDYKTSQSRFIDIFKDTKGKTLVLFGTGNMISHYKANANGLYPPAFFVDNDKNKWGSEIDGVSINSPDILRSISEEKLHLIICNNYFREIGTQLKRMGIKKYYIYTDNFPMLFGPPNQMEWYCSDNITAKCSVGFYLFFDEEITCHKIEKLKKAKTACEFLFVGIFSGEKSRGNLKFILDEIRFIHRSVVEEITDFTFLKEKYHVDCFFCDDEVFLLKNSKWINRDKIAIQIV